MVNRQRGFTYLGLLLAVVLIGLALASAGTLWSVARKREREQELLHIGHKFREAIGRYYENTPGIIKQYPPSLEALLRDDRFPLPRRYLRQIYNDPMTDLPYWGFIAAPSGGIMGVHSLGTGSTSKIANFSQADMAFEGKLFYAEWVFTYVPSALAARD